MRVRCYLPPEQWGDSVVRVTGREAHHLLRVLRVTSGDVVTCFDGKGSEARAVVEELSRGELTLRLEKKVHRAPPAVRVCLGVSIPGGGKWDQIVSQAAQMGVSEIFPLLTVRGVVKISLKEIEKKLGHWARIAVESAKQSGISWVPVVHPAVPWSKWVSSLEEYDLALIATPEGPHEEVRTLLSSRTPRRLLLLIGPEGDFSPEEIRQAVQHGAHRISLGPVVLKCETAAVAALSILFFLLREFDPRLRV